MSKKHTVILKHTRIEVYGYELGDCPSLEYTFSLWNPNTHISTTKILEYQSDKKLLIIPRGLDMSYVERIFMTLPKVDRNPDPYVNNDPIPIRYLTKDQRQLEILKFILGMDNYKYTRTKSQLCINASTGVGKTFLAVAAMCFTGARTIIITDAIGVLEQWRAKIYEYTPLLEKDIYLIKGSTSIDRLIAREEVGQYQVFLASHSTLKSYGDRYGWQSVDNLFSHLGCALKIYDEAHKYFDNMARIDFHSNTKKTLYLTATPERSLDSENDIYKMYFKNVPSIELFDKNKDPHVNYTAMHFNSHPEPADIKKCNNSYGFNRNAYIKYFTNQPIFYDILTILVDMMMHIDGKCLVYIGLNESVIKAYDYIVTEFPFLANHVGVYTSMVNKEEKAEALKKKIILSTTKSCGAAQDIAELRATIVLAEPFRSTVLARQTLGRCREDNTVYLDFVDNGFFFTKKYYKIKKPVFTQYAKSYHDTPLSDSEIFAKSDAIRRKYKEQKVMCMRVYKE